MYHGSHPTSGADRQPTPPPAAMLTMNSTPSVPSRPAPQPYTAPYTALVSSQRHAGAPSRDMFPLSQPHRPQHHDGNQSNYPQRPLPSHQLPSLRTFGLDTYLNNPRVPSSSAHPALGSSVRYGSSSPARKRRHDSDGYSHEHIGNNDITPRAPHGQHHAHNSPAADLQPLPYSAPGQIPSSRQPEPSHHGDVGRPPHNDSAGKMYPPPSTSSAPGVSSAPVGHFTGQPAHDGPMDIAKPVRRRTEGSSRAPVRALRCVGQRNVAGEGLCYVYEDGSHCRAIIDGERVNPSWGITKAGKPRKRLAQACNTCREKKIKCEPGDPKCTQCAKSQRPCSGGLSQSGMSNASGETSPSYFSAFKNQSKEHVSPVAGHDQRALDEHRDPSRTVEARNAPAVSPFRPRTLRPTSAATSTDMSVHSADSDWSGPMNNVDADDPRRPSHLDQRNLQYQWEQDPHKTQAPLTMHFLDLYFLHAGRATYGMFPRKPFLAWVETYHEKNEDHLMLLYAVLAMGSVFSNDPEHKAHGKRFADIAAYATEKQFGKFTLQLCQSRLMLALYKFACGETQEAWDFCGAGLRALSALKLNTEEGVRELQETAAEPDYGFDHRTLEECCRRTFWSAFLMDRYNGFCGGTMCYINIEDTFVRLPCLENEYEASNPCETPVFDFELLNPQAPPSPPLGHMAYLTLISAIWGEVLTFTSRAVHRPDNGYERLYEIFYAKTNERLDTWGKMLPPNLQYTTQNLNSSIAEGYGSTFISLHALYHTTHIRLNRHVRIRALSADKVARNIDRAFRNASTFLSMIHSLGHLPSNSASKYLFSTPIAGYALMLSVDVLSAAGTYPTLPNLIISIGDTVACLEELATFWASARGQQMAVSVRQRQLVDVAQREREGVRNGSYEQFWRLQESLETAFGGDDAIYKSNDQLLFDAWGKTTGRTT